VLQYGLSTLVNYLDLPLLAVVEVGSIHRYLGIHFVAVEFVVAAVPRVVDNLVDPGEEHHMLGIHRIRQLHRLHLRHLRTDQLSILK